MADFHYMRDQINILIVCKSWSIVFILCACKKYI